jgi:hypothetical protein
MHNFISHPCLFPAIQITGKTYVDEGHEIRLTCNATGVANPPDDLDWFKDGHKITTNYSKRKMTVDKFVSLNSKTIASTLRISHARMGDTGTYICRTSDLQVTDTKVNVLDGKCQIMYSYMLDVHLGSKI